MLSDSTLERVSSSYRNGYRDGSAGRPMQITETGLEKIGDDPICGTLKPFAAFDYEQGYAAGKNDARHDVPPPTPEQIEQTLKSRAFVAAWRARRA